MCIKRKMNTSGLQVAIYAKEFFFNNFLPKISGFLIYINFVKLQGSPINCFGFF